MNEGNFSRFSRFWLQFKSIFIIGNKHLFLSRFKVNEGKRVSQKRNIQIIRCGIRLDSVWSHIQTMLKLMRKYWTKHSSNSRPITSFLIITFCRQLVRIALHTHNICAFSIGIDNISVISVACVSIHIRIKNGPVSTIGDF